MDYKTKQFVNFKKEVNVIKGSHEIDRVIHGVDLNTNSGFDPVNGNFNQCSGLPNFIEGKLEPKLRSNPLKSSLKLTKTEAELIIKNAGSTLEVHAAHLYRMTITGGKSGKKQLPRYLIARTETIKNAGTHKKKDGSEAYNAQPDWDKEKYPIPLVGHIIRQNEIVVNHLLIMNDLTINQTECLIVKSPRFVINSCCYLDSGRNIRPISDLSMALKVLLLKKIQFYNSYMRNQAMNESERMELREQLKQANLLTTRNDHKIPGIVIEATQFQIDMFSKESIEGVMVETTGNSMIGRIGLTTSQGTDLIRGIEVSGSIDDLTIKESMCKAAPKFTDSNWYVTNGRTIDGCVDIEEGDIVWFKKENPLLSFGNYNLMVKPNWMKNINKSSVFENKSITDIENEIQQNTAEDESKVTKQLSSIVQSFNVMNPGHAKMLEEHLEAFRFNKYEIRKQIIVESMKANGMIDKSTAIPIPKLAYFDGFNGFNKGQFDTDMNNLINANKGTLDGNLKISGTPISAEELIHIWESINVLHRTTKIRVRGFKV